MTADTLAKIGRCQVRRCDVRISLDKLMCAPHWHLVPKPLQRAVYDAWETLKTERCSVNREAHRQACLAAIAAVDAQLAA